MFNPLNLFSKIIKTGNQKELNRIQKIVDKINNLEKNLENLDNTEFPKKTSELIQKLENGQTTNEILPDAFALVREVSKRVLK
jgi:preprotein translocase subunit SecA